MMGWETGVSAGIFIISVAPKWYLPSDFDKDFVLVSAGEGKPSGKSRGFGVWLQSQTYYLIAL